MLQVDGLKCASMTLTIECTIAGDRPALQPAPSLPRVHNVCSFLLYKPLHPCLIAFASQKMASSPLPPNVHVSIHPCLRAKISQLRSKDANARETKSLIHEVALIVGCEALAKSLQTTSSGTVSFICTATPTLSPFVQLAQIPSF